MDVFLVALENVSRVAIDALVVIIELVAVAVIGVAVLRATYHAASRHFRQQRDWYGDVRIELGRGIILALEFLIGADILRTTINPTWSLLGQLAVIIALRTVLDIFLERELRDIVRERQDDGT